MANTLDANVFQIEIKVTANGSQLHDASLYGCVDSAGIV